MKPQVCGGFWRGYDHVVEYLSHRNGAWECRIVANTSAFQAEDAGSIPVIPSTLSRGTDREKH